MRRAIGRARWPFQPLKILQVTDVTGDCISTVTRAALVQSLGMRKIILPSRPVPAQFILILGLFPVRPSLIPSCQGSFGSTA